MRGNWGCVRAPHTPQLSPLIEMIRISYVIPISETHCHLDWMGIHPDTTRHLNGLLASTLALWYNGLQLRNLFTR